jgi:two-component system response regulator RegA
VTKRAPNLLVADDDDVFREQLARALGARGVVPWPANGYETAMQVAAETPIDLAVIDLKLGKDNGLDLVRDLFRVAPQVKIVVLTGYGSIATAVRAVRLGALDYLAKPADADDVMCALGQASDVAEVPPDEPSASLARVEWEHIQRVLAECEGNVTHAARRLGLHRRSLQRKLARPPPD